jgi:hypothetical protein
MTKEDERTVMMTADPATLTKKGLGVWQDIQRYQWWRKHSREHFLWYKSSDHFCYWWFQCHEYDDSSLSIWYLYCASQQPKQMTLLICSSIFLPTGERALARPMWRRREQLGIRTSSCIWTVQQVESKRIKSCHGSDTVDARIEHG